MSKTRYIAEFSVGDEVSTLFLLGGAHQGQARNGPFWKLELRDASGSLEAKIWSPQSQLYTGLKAGDIVEAAGRVSMYRERLEIAVDRLRVLDEEERKGLDLARFMAASERPSSEMLAELEALCKATLVHGPWRRLIRSVLADPAVAERLPLAPAAKAMHHAYAGGLLEHTLGVARLCLALADLYPDLDRQTLLAGAVCHDLGKLWELSQGLATDYTGEGRLLGHIQLLLDVLEPLIRKAGLEDHLALHLKHLILSHHGQHEFGSPRLPSTAEAFALHHADNLDAKLNQAKGALSGVAEGESGWSAFVQGLDRAVFKPLPTPGAAPRAGEKTPGPKTGRRKTPAAEAGTGCSEGASGQLSLLGGM
ncbi:MAG: HD domain-containing protein [Deltaproteobacteria bacterium]|jgi:3'-5' exoribonuclease|nr:HD domain-containing protein [Deltaproteobacteria bacterium]